MTNEWVADGGWPAGVDLLRLAEVDSTSAEAFRLAQSGVDGPLWVTAVQQYAGRGRSGRNWQSEPGNLYASHMFRLAGGAGRLHHLAFVAGVAVHEAVTATLRQASVTTPVALKWPNDLLVDGDAKLGGILVEASTQGGQTTTVIGIGINIRHAPAIDGRRTVSLATIVPGVRTADILSRLASGLDHWLAIWQEGAGFEDIRAAWVERGPEIGQPLTVSDGHRAAGGASTGRRQGLYAGLDGDGALLLADESGKLTRITYGDVTLGWFVGQ